MHSKDYFDIDSPFSNANFQVWKFLRINSKCQIYLGDFVRIQEEVKLWSTVHLNFTKSQATSRNLSLCFTRTYITDNCRNSVANSLLEST